MFRRHKLHFLCVFSLVFALMIATIQIIPTNIESLTQDKFTNDDTSITLTFERGGVDPNSLAVEVPLNASILSASVDVEAEPYDGVYPTDVKVNVGNDEDYEWTFDGVGYGSLGKQTQFSNGEEKKYMYFSNMDYINTPRIKVPRNATVTGTSMILEGGTGFYGEESFVAIDYYGNKVSHILSNGDGTFTTPSTVATNLGSYQWSAVGLGDFDNDGDLDIVTGGGSSGNIYFIEKSGAGNSFKSPVQVGSVSTTWYIYDFAVGDFTNDGNYDFITSGSSMVLFVGNGDGTFKEPIQISGGPSTVYGKDAADFNNDGNLDFACGGITRNTVYYFEGNGDGTFKQPVQLNIPYIYYIYTVITDDFDGDGNADILVGYYDGNLYYFKGWGNGTFGSPYSTGVDAGSYSGGDAWDYDKDGDVDLIVINPYYENPPTYPGSEAQFWKNDGKGSFTKAATVGYVGSYAYGGAAPPPRVLGADNATLNIGDVSGAMEDWSHPGRLEGMQSEVSDFTTKMTNLLSSGNYPITRDRFNNEFVVIPLNFTSTSDGLLRVKEFHIEYTLTSTIEQKEFSTLADEMNEHIVFTGGETVELHFIVSTTTAGVLKFSNLNVEYNLPPDHKLDIPTLNAYEDTEDLHLLDLSAYFADTDEPSANLVYTVFKNTESDHVDVFTNNSNILKFKPITENWYGETKVIVQATDSGKKKTYSNEFIIKVNPVNDEPTAEIPLPDLTLIEGEVDKELDLELREYFTDIEDDLLYYAIEIDPRGFITDPAKKKLDVVKNDDNMLIISSIGDFNTYTGGSNSPVPVWIYADDDVDVDTYASGEFTYQEILVTVLPVNDKPTWKTIPKFTLYEDNVNTFKKIVHFYDYVADDETPTEALVYDITTTNSNINIIREGGYLSIDTVANYYGSAIVTITATDEKKAMSATTFELEILPVNDAPEITLTSHEDYQTVEGTIELYGKIFDIEETLRLVELKIESRDSDEFEGERFDWQRANLDLVNHNWTYEWDTTMVPDGYYLITAQVYDGSLTNSTSVELQILNGQNFEPIVEISYPQEYSRVNGTIIISGTVQDPDMDGINDLRIRIGAEMDWTKIPLQSENQTVWSYTWDTTTVKDNEYNILVKAYDGRAWSVPASRVVTVFNNITIKGGEKDEVTEDSSIWTFAIILIVVVLILGILVVIGLVFRGGKKVKEYVPDGRMEPLDDLEALVKPALGPGVSIEHQPLPPGTPSHAQVPGLPPAYTGGAGAGGYAPAPVSLSLPAAGIVENAPALPAASTVNVTPEKIQD